MASSTAKGQGRASLTAAGARKRVTAPLAQALWDNVPEVAEQAAASIMADPPCEADGTDDDACAATILSAFAADAYRRPLADEELADLLAVYAVGREGESFQLGIQTALEVVLQSAGILYRTELGALDAGGARLALTGYEVADQLSFLATLGPPDAELRADAAAGALDSADAREKHLRRLLATPAARVALAKFATEWLEIGALGSTVRDADAFPDWPELREPASAGTEAFFTKAVLDEDAGLETLLTADWTVADATLAPLYGGSEGDHVVPSHPHSGILTEVSVLASNAQNVDSSPVQRGHFVRVRLLCQDVPPPPATLMITLPEPDPTRTTRERFAQHALDPSCAGCHNLMDPIGFGLENFDAIGAYRETDNGSPVDATGTLSATDVDGDFNGPVELGRELAASEEARACFARHWLSYTSGRAIDDETWAELEASGAPFTDGEASVVSLLAAFVRSDSFVLRAPQTP